MEIKLQNEIVKDLEKLRLAQEGKVKKGDLQFRRFGTIDEFGCVDEVYEITLQTGQHLIPIAQISYQNEGQVEGFTLREIKGRLIERAEVWFKTQDELNKLIVPLTPEDVAKFDELANLRKK
jgi:hypothetical protein